MNNLKILYTGNLKDHHRLDIEQDFPQVQVVSISEEEELAEEILDTDILVAWGRFISPELIKRAENLKWVHALSTGVEKFLIPEIITSSIPLSNSRGIHKEQISEHVFSFILGHARRQFDFQCHNKQNHQWERLHVGTLARRTLAVVGLGAIGEEIARKGQAFDMKVLATKGNPRPSDYVDEVLERRQLDQLLTQGDYVVLTVPLTDQTRELIGARELEKMKESAMLINIARGEVVDEQALYQALLQEQIAAAGLDVFHQEPLPEDSPLWKLDNCYITPHVGGASPDYIKKAVELFKQNLTAFIAEKDLPTEVDKHRGY